MNKTTEELYIDNEYIFNVAITILILAKYAVNRNGILKLDFEKLQVFLYLIKNPCKINLLLEKLNKKPQPIAQEQIYTIESFSNNTDILFDRSRIKYILQKIAALEILQPHIDKNEIIYFKLSEEGILLAKELEREYSFIPATLDSIKSLQSVNTSKILNTLNIII